MFYPDRLVHEYGIYFFLTVMIKDVLYPAGRPVHLNSKLHLRYGILITPGTGPLPDIQPNYCQENAFPRYKENFPVFAPAGSVCLIFDYKLLMNLRMREAEETEPLITNSQ